MKHCNYQSVESLSLRNEKIILRADFDAPRKLDHTIEDDFRLKETLKTVIFLQQQSCTLILIGHAGNPTLMSNGTPSPEDYKNYTLRPVVAWFKKQGIHAKFAATLEEATQKSTTSQSIVILENLRFFSGEKKCDPTFAQSLRKLGTYFIQDAFAAMHRNDCSVTLLPILFSPEKRGFGIATNTTLQLLTKITHMHAKTTYLIGGAKIRTKLPLIQKLMLKSHALLITPPLCFTFMRAIHQETGTSLVDQTCIPLAQSIIKNANKDHAPLLFPLDFTQTTSTFENPQNLTITETIAPHACGISIGPKTIDFLKKYIEKSEIIILNGPQGTSHFPKTTLPFQDLLNSINHNKHAIKILIGGDTLAEIHNLHFDTRNWELISGGGATLAFLANHTLPGLKAMLSASISTTILN